jgi:diguanylate cyclase
MRAAGVDIAQQDALHKRVSLDNDVAAQMDDLQRTSASATALEPLKQLVSLRLRKITQQIQTHNLQEQLERDKNQNELMGLVQKIKDMESETVELKSRLEVAQERATRDPLTQLPNRLAFEERLTDEFSRVHRFTLPLTMAVWDIDFFKNINDSFGHKSGDKALVIIAKLLNSHCRETDFVARVGGEEFVMLLPDTDGQSAMIVVNKLREVIEKSSFNANGKKISITLSCGVTEYIEGDTNESLFVRADGALYQAKQSGRNQCVLV